MTGENDPVLHLSKLVKGRYIFKLTVTDDKGLTDSDTVAVNIKESELFIFKTMSAFLNALIFFPCFKTYLIYLRRFRDSMLLVLITANVSRNLPSTFSKSNVL